MGIFSFKRRAGKSISPLTPKQERFAMLIANGRNHTEAYRDTYNTEQMGDNSVHREAHRLTQNPKVVSRINELKRVASKNSGVVSQLEGKIADLATEVSQLTKIIKQDSIFSREYLLSIDTELGDLRNQEVKANTDMLTEIYDALTDPGTKVEEVVETEVVKAISSKKRPYSPRNTRRKSKLTVEEIESAEPRDKRYKLFDGNGLHLCVYANGKKTWALSYAMGTKRRSITIGGYPDVDLDTARSRKQEAITCLKEGKDPFELGAKWRKRLERKRAREQKATEEKPFFISRNQAAEVAAIEVSEEPTRAQRQQADRWTVSPARSVKEILDDKPNTVEKKPEKKEKKKASRDSDYSHLASLRYDDLKTGLMGRLCLSLVKSCGADKRYASERFRLQASQSLDLFRDDKTIGQIRMMQPREFEKTGEVRLLTYMGIASRLCKAILLLGSQQERVWLVDVDTDGQPRSIQKRKEQGRK